MLPFVVRTLIRSSSSVISSVPYTTSSVSYLTRVWGLSPEQANSAAKFVTIESTETADSVFKLLKSCGFSNSDVLKLISKQPGSVAVDAENDLRPKIDYLTSLGISESHLQLILGSNKGILSNPLKNIVPMFDFFKEFLKSNEDLVCVIRNSSRVIKRGSESTIRRCVVPNISTLQAHGVPYHVIVRLMAWNPQALCLNIDLFDKAVKRVEEMGFEPGKVTFMLGLNSVGMTSTIRWQRKRELFTKLGWSEAEFVSAFRRQPTVMLCSENKIIEVMDFLVSRLGLTPSETARYPHLFLLSLERRMVPRCSVLRVLTLSGKFQKQPAAIYSALKISDSAFREKYVTVFEKDVPDVVEAFRGQLEFKGFTDECES